MPAAAIVLVVVIGAVLLLGRGDDGTETAAPDTSSVDISNLDDPATTPPTTTAAATSTTLVTADGRVLVASASGIEWSMGAAPEVDDIVSDESPDPVGQLWQAHVDEATTEVVEITDLGGEAFDAAAAVAAITSPFDAELADLEASHIAEAPGQTASFTGSLDGRPVVGYVVTAQVGDQSLTVMTFRDGDDLDGLYLDFLDLPATFVLP